MTAAYKTGELDPSSFLGFATITEYVVIDVLGDATKEKFCAPYDLYSQSLGKVNVKCSALRHESQTRNYWYFSKSPSAQIPDNYVCIGMDRHQTEILKVWIIPGKSKVVTKKGINISPRRYDRVDRYEVDSAIYDKTFQEMDIKTKPEFRNTTKPKINENNLILKKTDLEFQEDLKAMKDKTPAVNPVMREFIECSPKFQNLVLLSIVRVAKMHKFPLDYSWVINYYSDLAAEDNWSYGSFRKVENSISAWGSYGVIKLKYPKIKAINADMNEIEEIILGGSEFAKIKNQCLVKDAIMKLLKNQKSITRTQIKEASGIEDPEEEIMDLIKKGIIMEVGPDDIRWV